MSKKKIKKNEEYEDVRIALENMVRKNALNFLTQLTEAMVSEHSVTSDEMLHWRGVVCHTLIHILFEEAGRIDEESGINDIVIPGTGTEA